MNQRRNAIILIACALILAIGAYVLFTDSKQEDSVVRQNVKPIEETAQAPAWVGKGQQAEPDYSAADTEAQNATPQPDKDQVPTVIEISEDELVTYTFVESLADFMLNKFLPQDAQGKPTTLASAKSLNMYYGQELDGFGVRNNDIRMARKTVLDYAFTPAMITTLYDLYIPIFMEHIVDTASTDDREFKVKGQPERRTLTNAEISVMLKLQAGKIDQTARVFRAIASDPAITQMAGKYLQAAKAVGRTNVQLQNAIADGKDTSKPSSRLKQAIVQREQIKKSIVSRLKKACKECPDSELFYLAQWSYRRVLNEPDGKLETFAVAADVLDDMAQRFRTTSTEIK
ncbi:hypothetical protein OAN24_00425 [Pseudodesulfovibrio sp.]|nr:hypothetical protein [Pseudodesulfovibrio sp.]